MSHETLHGLGGRLAGRQSMDAGLAERCSREIDRILRNELKLTSRILLALLGVALLLIGAAVLAAWMVGFRTALPFMDEILLSLGVYVAIAGVTLNVVAAVGRDPHRSAIWFGLTTLFIIAFATRLLREAWRSDDELLRGQFMQCGYVMLGLVGIATILFFVEWHFRRIELRFLQIEYLLVGLDARRENDQPRGSDA